MANENVTDRRERELREQLWPGSSAWIWDRNDKANVKGFATIPRLLPLIMILIDELKEPGEGDARMAYLELWSRARDNQIISIKDEEEIAYASHCTRPKRAARTWKEHMRVLRRLGFILIAADGNREIGHILLVNPLAVAARIHRERSLSPSWWSALNRRAAEVGAKIPDPSLLPAFPSEPVCAVSG